MKKIWGYLLLLIFSSFSFYLMQKTISFIKEKDDVMLSLKNIEDKYYQKQVDAIINQDTIIPGLNGYKVIFENNTAKEKAAISLNGDLSIDNVIFRNNSSTGNSHAYGAIGGFQYAVTVDISNTLY